MHLLAWLALALGIVAVVSAFLGIPPKRSSRALSASSRRSPRRALAVSVSAAALSLAIGASLLLAQQQVCGLLGGDWIAAASSCRHELGGNGNNDVGNSWAPLTEDAFTSTIVLRS